MTATAQGSKSLAPAQTQHLAWFQYSALIVIFTGVLLIFVSLIHVRGGFAHPYWFFLFRRSFYLQYALFGGALLATLLYVAPARIGWLGRAMIFAPFHLCCVWLVLWCLVHRTFGIELTPETVIAVLTNQAPIATMGVSAVELAVTLVIAAFLVAVLTALTELAYRKYQRPIRRRLCGIAILVFAAVHIPTRSYFAYEIDHNAYVALAFDDCVPFPLRTERLIGALHKPRISLPNYESPNAAQKYLEHMRTCPLPAIPRPNNILWINVESLRYDALDEETMPQTWKYRDRFQIRLNEQHWSSGNTTHFAVFSELSGLSGFQMNNFRTRRVTLPFLRLLQSNGYHIRVADKDHLESANLSMLVPKGAEMVDVDTPEYGGDKPVTDAYLGSRRSGSKQLRFDFIAFDATHWPYSYPLEDAVFQPAIEGSTSTHVLRSTNELRSIRNRYRNACHFVDSQIGRVLDDLEGSGGFADTIVVVCGDHGQEFQERDQLTHSAVLNDFQARTVLWMHFPNESPGPRVIDQPTLHADIVPTILQSLGFEADVLYTQGYSLLGHLENRQMLSLCEQGWAIPTYRALVTKNYISRWRYRPTRYLFSGVQRRDGGIVEGSDWLSEVRHLYPQTVQSYEVLPDIARPPRPFNATPAMLSAN